MSGIPGGKHLAPTGIWRHLQTDELHESQLAGPERMGLPQPICLP
jgi:hypothetical protein